MVGLKGMMTVPLEFVNGTNWSPASTALQGITEVATMQAMLQSKQN